MNVPTSTSSSNDRIPTPPGAILGAGSGPHGGLAGSLGAGPARMGFRQGAAEIESWVHVRGRVGPDATVFVGSSRIRAAIDPEVWRARRGGPMPVQLALPFGQSIDIF